MIYINENLPYFFLPNTDVHQDTMETQWWLAAHATHVTAMETQTPTCCSATATLWRASVKAACTTPPGRTVRSAPRVSTGMPSLPRTALVRHIWKKNNLSNLDGISCFQRVLMIALFPICITQDATVLLVALNVVTLTQGSATVSLVWWEPTVTAVGYVCSSVLSLSIVSFRRLKVLFCFV